MRDGDFCSTRKDNIIGLGGQDDTDEDGVGGCIAELKTGGEE